MISILIASAAQAACTVISGASVHTPSGLEKGASVVLVDDRVAAVGRGLRDLKLEMDAQQRVSGAKYRGAACRFVQGGGKQVSAGLVAAPTKLGLVEISLEQGTRADNARTDDPIRASLRVTYAYDPRSSLIRVNRAEGITSALVVPEGAFVPGFAGMVQLDGDTRAEAVLSDEALLPIQRRSGSLAEDLQQIRELVEDARRYGRNRSAYEARVPFLEGASRLDLQAMQPVVRRQLPVGVGANRASDIEAIIELQDELDIDLVIFGAAEGWRHAEALAEAKIAVVVDPMVYGPGSFDEREGRPDNAAILASAGVDVVLTSGLGGAHNLRVLRQVAGNAVRGGMTHGQALAAITSTPSRVFGQADRGRIEAGAKADVALWSGDPLELSTSLEGLWVSGQAVDLRTRQTELTNKYLELPATPAPPLSLP